MKRLFSILMLSLAVSPLARAESETQIITDSEQIKMITGAVGISLRNGGALVCKGSNGDTYLDQVQAFLDVFPQTKSITISEPPQITFDMLIKDLPTERAFVIVTMDPTGKKIQKIEYRHQLRNPPKLTNERGTLLAPNLAVVPSPWKTIAVMPCSFQ